VEKTLFEEDELTQVERENYEHKTKILSMAEKKKSLEKTEDRYYFPESYLDEKGNLDKKKQNDVLYGRYTEVDKDQFTTEQEKLEKELVYSSLTL